MRNVQTSTWISIIILSAALWVGCGSATSLPRQGGQTPTPAEATAAPAATATPRQGEQPGTPSEATAAPPTVVDQMTPDAVPPQLVEQARADLARRLGLPADSFRLKQAVAVEWPDTSLGCPQPGFMYAQVVTSGYLIVLGADDKEYEYHADRSRVSLCDK